MNKILIQFFVLSFFSCSLETKQELSNKEKVAEKELVIPQNISIKDRLQKYLATQNIELKSNHIYYITEMAGCGFCVEKSIEYAQQSSKDNITFIFSTDKKGAKRLKNMIGSSLSKNNVFVDTQNFAYQYSVTESKPTLFFVYKDSISTFEFLTSNFPEGFGKIEEF